MRNGRNLTRALVDKMPRHNMGLKLIILVHLAKRPVADGEIGHGIYRQSIHPSYKVRATRPHGGPPRLPLYPSDYLVKAAQLRPASPSRL